MKQKNIENFATKTADGFTLRDLLYKNKNLSITNQ